jgi:murein DD-endopeptidase MepM/ murein hydrolase activator NlpD
MRQFNVSYLFIGICALLVVGAFVANIFLTVSYIKSQSHGVKIARLQNENEMLLAKYDDLNGRIEEINGNYEELVEKEIIIRNIFNLPDISRDERQLGIGGPRPMVDENLTAPVRVAYQTQTDVDALLRLSRFEKEKFEEIYGTLVEKKSILDHTPSIMPCKGYRSRGFGMKYDPFTGYKRFHGGLDISNKTGTPVYATADGVVSFGGNTGGDLGRMITVNHGYGYKTRYGHLNKVKVQRGQKVRRGDMIGLMGSTGYSTGPHLHYEVLVNDKRVNPLEYILN